ncbi:MAG: hypothetical protein EOS34_28080 [Mesorhizobium sp.]|nr:MAG: hypothetical protein EOS34_28080 [Mesorhizobium sp.]
MIVEEINWLSIAAKEAEIVISDGEFRCSAYSQPCCLNVGDQLTEPLHIFGLKAASLANFDVMGAWKIGGSGTLAQRIHAKVQSIKDRSLLVGNIQLVTDDPLPGGIVDGDMVALECARIDAW